MIDVKEMERTGLLQERLFAELRCNAILHLGEVERLYIEANGAFTLVKANIVNGLSIIAIQDERFLDEFEFDSQHQVCGFCGDKPNEEITELICRTCGHKEWKPAMNR